MLDYIQNNSNTVPSRDLQVRLSGHYESFRRAEVEDWPELGPFHGLVCSAAGRPPGGC